MKIKSLDTCIVEIPFEDGGKGLGITPSAWRTLETTLVRVEDTDGHVGWGEGFSYFIADATRSVIDTRIKPLVEGATIDSIAEWNRQTQKKLHLFGRYGITLFAISGVDMALWDLRAQREKAPLYAVLGGSRPHWLKSYASLVAYGEGAAAGAMSERALAEGFDDIKLHETALPVIEACHQAIAGRAPIAIDVNCAWDQSTAVRHIERLQALGNIAWLEEPIFPPEDYAGLAQLRARGVALAAGENWCTATQFRHAVQAGAVDFLQPSVTKVGGITEFVDIMGLAGTSGMPVLPHCPYFGPGFLATLHLATAYPEMLPIEYLYVDPAAWLLDLPALRKGNRFRVPDAPGLGMAPDNAVIQRFLRAPR